MGKNKQHGLIPPKTAEQLMDMYYLQARSHLLETAAILDRIERADGGGKAMEDQRIQKLFEICKILTQGKANRAEQFLNLLSVS